MILHPVRDWDDAYANVPHIAGGEAYTDRWLGEAAAFRAAMAAQGRFEEDVRYGPAERNTLDLFMPQGEARGLFVFIHGGYWMRFDKSVWSHLAAGPLARGFAVAMPRYTLCPQVRIRDIAVEMAAAVTLAARRVAGPIVLSGHSAGGHLAARLVSRSAPTAAPLSGEILDRVVATLSISGVHDLRPLMRIALNQTFRLDMEEARAESPALLEPATKGKVICWVGGGERSEFIRQSELLANVWRGLDAAAVLVEEPDRHHFNVIDGLADPRSPMLRAALD